MTGIPAPASIYTKQARIAELARQMPGTALRSLSRHMDMDWLREAFRRTRKDGAVGVDCQTADQYAENLEENLQSLLDRAKSGTYRAPPVRRVHIPKGDGTKTRPIGIPAFEDKVLQRAVAMLLEPVYEGDFYDFSYGFRPRRSAHDALETLQEGIRDMGGGVVLEVDISSFFDTLVHQELRNLLRQRVVDGVVAPGAPPSTASRPDNPGRETTSAGFPVTRRARCGNSARLDPWGAGGGNPPGLPDREQQKACSTHVVADPEPVVWSPEPPPHGIQFQIKLFVGRLLSDIESVLRISRGPHRCGGHRVRLRSFLCRQAAVWQPFRRSRRTPLLQPDIRPCGV